MGNSVEILEPVGGNSVEIIGPKPNSVEIKPHANSVECSLFDVTTTSYFLSASQTLEEHKEAE